MRDNASMKVPLPAPLRKQTIPFDDPDWIYEIKHDGFRALAMIEGGTCRFVSRKNHTLARYQQLGEAVAHEVKARTAVPIEWAESILKSIDHSGFRLFRDGDERLRKYACIRRWRGSQHRGLLEAHRIIC